MIVFINYKLFKHGSLSLYYLVATFGSVSLSFLVGSVFFGLSTFFALISLSTNSITAIGASSPVLKPAFKTLEYPPFLFAYLFERFS